MDIVAFWKKQSVLRLVLILVVVGVGVWILALRWQHNRVVSRVSVVGTALLRQQEILDLVKFSGVHSVRDVNTAEMEKRVLKHPFVRKVSVFLNASDVLTVSVEERKPIAIVVSKGRQYYVDAESKLLPYRLTEVLLDLPLVSGFGRGVMDSLRLAKAITTMQTLQEHDSRLYKLLSEIDMHTNGEMTLHFTNKTVPIRFGTDENKEMKIAQIAAFLHHAEQTHAKFTNVGYVDVRWENQIVVHPVSN